MSQLNRIALVCIGSIGFAFAESPASAQTYNLAGPAASISSQSGSWSWNGFIISPFRNALVDSTNFGPGGTVETSLSLFSLDTIDAASLNGIDGFISPWWWESDMPAGAGQAVVDFFLAGGDLFLLQDDTSTDGIGTLLGLSSSASNGSVSNGTGPSINGPVPLMDGPFGLATDVFQSGNTGRLDPDAVAAANGHVGAVNANGQITAAFWDENEFAPGAGRLVILGDIDMVSSDTASYDPLNSNGIFALNTVTYLIGGKAAVDPNPNPNPDPVPVPLPAAAWMGLSMLGFLGVAQKLRSRRNA